MAEVLKKEFSCFNCKKTILISKIDNPAPGSKKKWEQWELDSVTPHKCKKEQEQEQQQPAFDTTTQRAILELLQMVDKKLNALLANSGTKTPT